MVYVGQQARFSIANVEPPSIPPFQQGVKGYWYVFPHHTIPQLKKNPADHFGGSRSKEGFRPEEITKEIEVQSDSDERFT